MTGLKDHLTNQMLFFSVPCWAVFKVLVIDVRESSQLGCGHACFEDMCRDIVGF